MRHSNFEQRIPASFFGQGPEWIAFTPPIEKSTLYLFTYSLREYENRTVMKDGAKTAIEL